MTQVKDTMNFHGLLFQCTDTEHPMLIMLEWLYSQMMEGEISSKIGSDSLGKQIAAENPVRVVEPFVDVLTMGILDFEKAESP